MKQINPLLSKLSVLQSNPSSLQSMVALTKKKFPYLERSSDEGLLFLAELMLNTHFLAAGKPTPILASFHYFKWVANQKRSTVIFNERDFVFLIKMFGLHVRNIRRIYSFCPGNEPLDLGEDVAINDDKQVKQLEFYLSGVSKLNRVQNATIESMLNKLLRDTREIELAHILADLIKNGSTVGQARNYLEEKFGVKAHEFVRIRAYANELNLYVSGRKKAEKNRRVTIDEELSDYVNHLCQAVATNKNKPLTPSQAVNQALSFLKKLTAELSQNSSNGDVLVREVKIYTMAD